MGHTIIVNHSKIEQVSQAASVLCCPVLIEPHSLSALDKTHVTCLFHETQSFTNSICFTQQSQPQQCCSPLHHQLWRLIPPTLSTTAGSPCTSHPWLKASMRKCKSCHLRDTQRPTAFRALASPSNLHPTNPAVLPNLSSPGQTATSTTTSPTSMATRSPLVAWKSFLPCQVPTAILLARPFHAQLALPLAPRHTTCQMMSAPWSVRKTVT